MSVAVPVFAMGCTGLATGVVVILLLQLLRAGRRVQPASQSLPLFMSPLRIPAMLTATAVTPFLSASQLQRIGKVLASVELESVLTPASWIGMRFMHALTTALFAALAAILIGASAIPIALMGCLAGYSLGGLWVRKARRLIEQRIARDLPSYLDLLTVCVEAGATLTAGVNQIIEGAPDSPLRRYFEHVLREVRGGQLRAHAFERVAALYAVPSLSALAAALGHAESSGMSLGGILRGQGQQRIAERFARAERLAMQAPVKLLGPLILCIFPCTFIVLAVPIVVRLAEAFAS
ncbi:MAG: type II secretion system F family protein [Pseudomonadota bacterium]